MHADSLHEGHVIFHARSKIVIFCKMQFTTGALKIAYKNNQFFTFSMQKEKKEYAFPYLIRVFVTLKNEKKILKMEKAARDKQ